MLKLILWFPSTLSQAVSSRAAMLAWDSPPHGEPSKFRWRRPDTTWTSLRPPRALHLSKMTASQRGVLRKAAQGDKPVISPKGKTAKLVAGDNQAEAAVKIAKNLLRRTNKLGRNAPRTKHVDMLASKRLLAKPGLSTVLQAMACYRQHRAELLGCSPADFAVLGKDTTWLF